MQIGQSGVRDSAGEAVVDGLHRPSASAGDQDGRPGLLARISRPDIVDAALLAIIAGLIVATEGFLAAPRFEGRVAAPAVDVALHTVSLLASAAVVAFSLGRYRERREPMALYQAAAFTALALAAAVGLAVTLDSLDIAAGAPQRVPGQEPLYVLLAARLLGGCLLVLGGWVSLRGAGARHVNTILLPAILLTGLVALIQGSPYAAPSPFEVWIGDALQILVGGMFLSAAGIYRALWRRERSTAAAYFAIAMVLAAFAMLHGVLYPSVYRGFVATADLLRLAWSIVLMLGIEEDSRATLRGLREANQALDRLRRVEVERAGLEERARLARELHDGLAQDVWLAKLKVDRLSRLLAGHDDLEPEARALTGEVADSIESTLVEARGAVSALRDAAQAGDPLWALVARHVDDFEDRFGLRVEFERARELPRLPPKAEGEVLRIVQEALMNVRKHADATLVRIRAGQADGTLILSVTDNGAGFDPAVVGTGRFGITSMRERAALIGGALVIDSAPDEGTTVRLTVPVGGAAARAGEEPD